MKTNHYDIVVVFIVWIVFLPLMPVSAAVITIPLDYPTIQEGLNSAHAGDTVLLSPGIYHENIQWPGTQNLTLTSTSVPNSTILDGKAMGRVITLPGASAGLVRIEKVTIQNGFDAEKGAGILAENSRLHIRECHIVNNVLDDPDGSFDDFIKGAGMFGRNGDIYIDRCVFSGNTIGSESSSFNSVGAGISEGTLTVTNSIFHDNHANGWGEMTCGGGIHGCLLSISNCLFYDNSSIHGGAVGESTGYIEFSTFDSNSSYDLCLAPPAYIDMNSCILGTVFGYANVIYSRYRSTDGDIGPGCFKDDPVFVTGPLGDYYLSQIDSGQTENSPCVDHADPTLVCQGTTRSDHVPDAGVYDMGYHYLAPQEPFGMKLVMDDTDLKPGDRFYLHYFLYNPAEDAWDADVYILLDVYGMYWLYPSWVSIDDGIDFKSIPVPGNASYHESVLDFYWPEGFGTVDEITFYGAAMDHGTFDIAGTIQMIRWGFSE